jgi:hypothetical protein
MPHYAISIDCGQGRPAFRGRFSERDVRHLQSPRRGRCFDLENFKAYVDAHGYIALARKPDYLVHTTLKYSELLRHLDEAREAAERRWLSSQLAWRLRDCGYRAVAALIRSPL